MSDISSLNFIKVEKWKGEGENSCFWNIAANQLGEGATNAEIAELTNQIKALNAEKNSSVIRKDDILYTEDTVLIPLEYAIDEITTNIGTKTTEISEANTTFTTAQGNLTDANNNVATALSELQSAQSSLDSLGEKDDKESAQQAVADAQKKYTDALQKQQEALQKQQEAEENLNTKKEELDDLETELKDIQEEYKDAEDVSQEDLDELEDKMGELDEEIQKAEGNLEKLKEDAAKETAQAQQKAAENITTTDKDGNITMKEGVTANDIEKANNSGQGTYDKSKLKEIYQGGGITKYYDEFGNEINADLIKDADNIQKHIAKLDSLTDEEAIKRYDIDGDGKVTNMDATALQKENSEENETTSENNGNAKEESEEEAAMREELAQSRAKELFEAIDGWGTDEDAVKEIFNNVKGQDLLDVAAEYEAKYNESLEDAIRGDFSGKEEDNLLDKLEDAEDEVRFHEIAGKEVTREEISKDSIMESQLRRFKEATDGAGTDEAALTELIQGMSKQGLKEFTEYSKKQGVDIKQVIEDETSGNYEKTLTSSIDSAQNYKPTEDKTEDEKRKEMANARADQLFLAIDGWGTDEDAVKEIFNNVKGQDLLDVAAEYEAKYNESLEDAIRGDFSGKEEDNLLDKLEDAEDEVRFHEIAGKEVTQEDYTDEKLAKERATAFYEAIDGWGTDEDVIKDLMSLNDVEIIAMAKALEDQGENIITLIEKDFSGKTEKSYKEKLKRLGIE